MSLTALLMLVFFAVGATAGLLLAERAVAVHCRRARMRFRARVAAAHAAHARFGNALSELLRDAFFGTAARPEAEGGAAHANVDLGGASAPVMRPQETARWQALLRSAAHRFHRFVVGLRPPALEEHTIVGAASRYLSILVIAAAGISAAASEAALFSATFPEYLPRKVPPWLATPGVLIAWATLASCVTWGVIVFEAAGHARGRAYRGRGLALIGLIMICIALAIAVDAARVRGVVDALNAGAINAGPALRAVAATKLQLFVLLAILIFATAALGVAASVEWLLMSGAVLVFICGSSVRYILLSVRLARAEVMVAPATVIGFLLRAAHVAGRKHRRGPVEELARTASPSRGQGASGITTRSPIFIGSGRSHGKIEA